jgi:hypothetical protein
MFKDYILPSGLLYYMIRVLLFEMHRRGTPFWAWSAEEWLESVCPDPTTFALRYGRSSDAGNIDQARRFLPILSYLFHLPPAVDTWLQWFKPYALARKIFGSAAIDAAASQLTTILQSWGYHQEPATISRPASAICCCGIGLPILKG